MAQKENPNYQAVLESLSLEETKALTVFIDSVVEGASRAWFHIMFKHMGVPNEVLEALVEKEIVIIGEEAGDETLYRLADPDFHDWATRNRYNI